MTLSNIETSARTVGAVAEELYLKCIRCGKCLSVCPVYRETRVETLSPRGKVALYRAVDEDGLGVGEVYADKFYTCLMCEACREVCPSGVELDVILNQSRADLAHSGPAFGDAMPVDLAGRARMTAADDALIEAMCAGDAQAFYEQVAAENDRRNVCGLSPIYLTLRLLGETTGERAGYERCPADQEGASWVSVCGVVLE